MGKRHAVSMVEAIHRYGNGSFNERNFVLVDTKKPGPYFLGETIRNTWDPGGSRSMMLTESLDSAYRMNLPEACVFVVDNEDFNILSLDDATILIVLETWFSQQQCGNLQHALVESSMEIEVTQVDRGRYFEIGYARAHRAAKTNGWSIYCTLGPSWVWNYIVGTWEICTNLTMLPEFHERPFEEAKRVLATVKTKRQMEEELRNAQIKDV